MWDPFLKKALTHLYDNRGTGPVFLPKRDKIQSQYTHTYIFGVILVSIYFSILKNYLHPFILCQLVMLATLYNILYYVI